MRRISLILALMAMLLSPALTMASGPVVKAAPGPRTGTAVSSLYTNVSRNSFKSDGYIITNAGLRYSGYYVQVQLSTNATQKMIFQEWRVVSGRSYLVRQQTVWGTGVTFCSTRAVVCVNSNNVKSRSLNNTPVLDVLWHNLRSGAYYSFGGGYRLSSASTIVRAPSVIARAR
jgi:hypothetical protein